MALTKKLELELLAQGKGCLGKAADDEPVFVLRAQDRSAPRAIREWAAFLASHSNNPPAKKIAEALAIAYAMDAWQAANPGKTKWPD